MIIAWFGWRIGYERLLVLWLLQASKFTRLHNHTYFSEQGLHVLCPTPNESFLCRSERRRALMVQLVGEVGTVATTRGRWQKQSLRHGGCAGLVNEEESWRRTDGGGDSRTTSWRACWSCLAVRSVVVVVKKTRHYYLEDEWRGTIWCFGWIQCLINEWLWAVF